MNKPLNQEFDVVVIGGGVSGCTAAHTIAQKDPGLTILVLEETGRLGGNPYSSTRSIELISNTNHYLKHLLKQLHLKLMKRHYSGAAVGELTPGKISYSDGDIPLFSSSSLQKIRFEYFLAKIENVCEQVSLNSPMASLESEYLDGISMDDYICENVPAEESRNYMRTIVQTNCGVQAKDMSALFYIAYCNSTGGVKNQLDRSLNGSTGYYFENAGEQICNAMWNLGTFKVNLNERAKGIWREHASINVITDAKRYKCLYVVAAVPPDNIIMLDIRPALHERRSKILHEMSFNMMETTVVNYSVPEHLSGDIFCGVEKDNYIQRSVDIQQAKPNGLFLYLYYNDYQMIRRQLDKYYGGGGDCECTSSDDDYHHYKICCVPAMGTLKDFHEIRRPLFRLFWAGSHTSTVSYGHMEGAVYSGMRAGIELLYDYKPQVLTRHDIIFLTDKKRPVAVFKQKKLNKLIRHRKTYYMFSLISVLMILVGVYKKYR